MQKPCEHLARTSSQQRGSCVFLFRLGTRNLRLPTAASNHRRCTHTNTLAQTHNVSHDSLTLLFFSSLLSYTHTRRLAVTSKTQTRKHANPPRQGDTFVQFSRKHGSGGQTCPPRSLLVLTQEGKSGAFSCCWLGFYCCKEGNEAGRPVTNTPRIPLPCF